MPELIEDTDYTEFVNFFATLHLGTGKNSDFPGFRNRLAAFLREVLSENEKINLTAIRDWQGGLWKHAFDSITLAKLQLEGHILDWGTGGGFPGVPYFLFREEVCGIKGNVTLCDSIGKKVAAVERILDRAQIEGLSVVQERGERLITREKFDVCVLRAVAKPEEARKWISNRVSTWCIMTGPQGAEAWEPHFEQIKKKFRCEVQQYSFDLPRNSGSRVIFRLNFT